MKKVLALISLTTCLLMAGCGGDSTQTAKPDNEPTEPIPEVESEAVKGSIADLYAPDAAECLDVTGLLVANPWEENSYILCEVSEQDSRWEYLNSDEALEIDGLDAGVGVKVRFEYDKKEENYVYTDIVPAECGFTFDDVETKFKSLCTEYDYEELVRNPALHKEEKVKKTLYVFQVIEDEEYPGFVELLAYADQGKYGIGDDIVCVFYQKHSSVESRILEDDAIDVYGISRELYTYETRAETSMTVPCIQAAYIDLRN